ncbi:MULTISPECIES: H-NS family nucleoid-associated regulatory protein [Cupriavidus]|uniref:H-NS family nucleoid-associated regulatory protein n=1 Tax=Cupriavidus TaxID=106589 RepID=UPI00358F563E
MGAYQDGAIGPDTGRFIGGRLFRAHSGTATLPQNAEGQTWDGRGERPDWFQRAINAGQQPEFFQID